MFRSILVPLDGSPFGEEALPTAEALARRSAARLHLAHVRVPVLAPGESDPEGHARARQYLHSAAERACEELGESCSFALLERGGAGLPHGSATAGISEALATYVADEGIELVVMTSHGRSGLSRAWLGSVADAFVRRCSVPVLLLRPGRGRKGAADVARGGFRNVLVPLDGSPASEQVVPAARAVAAEGARLHLVRVVAPAFDVAGPYALGAVQLDEATTVARRTRAEEDLEAAAARLREEDLDVESAVLTDPVPADAILGYAEDRGIDLIAMSTRGLGGWSRLVLGSTADKVVRGTVCPVLVLRPEGVEHESAEVASGAAASAV